jgi:large subunit ribosomal protein L28
MAYVCEICDKKTVTGRSQRHKRGVAGKRWRKRAPKTSRLFKPNLQKVSLKINDEKKRMRLCTKCIKRIKKYGSIKNYSSVTLA